MEEQQQQEQPSHEEIYDSIVDPSPIPDTGLPIKGYELTDVDWRTQMDLTDKDMDFNHTSIKVGKILKSTVDKETGQAKMAYTYHDNYPGSIAKMLTKVGALQSVSASHDVKINSGKITPLGAALVMEPLRKGANILGPISREQYNKFYGNYLLFFLPSIYLSPFLFFYNHHCLNF